MQWRNIRKEVATLYKHRSWLLLRTSTSVVYRTESGLSVSRQHRGMSLILDCSLDQMFDVLEQLGPGISYAAALASSSHLGRQPQAAPQTDSEPHYAWRLAC